MGVTTRRLDRIPKDEIRGAVMKAVEQESGRIEGWWADDLTARLLGGSINDADSLGLLSDNYHRETVAAQKKWSQRVRRVMNELSDAGRLVKVGKGERTPSGQLVTGTAFYYAPAEYQAEAARAQEGHQRLMEVQRRWEQVRRGWPSRPRPWPGRETDMANTSYLVCWRDGIPVYGHRGGWQHKLGGKSGAIPASKRHYPVPVPRVLYEEAYDLRVTRERFWEIRAYAEAVAARMQAEHPQGRKDHPDG